MKHSPLLLGLALVLTQVFCVVDGVNASENTVETCATTADGDGVCLDNTKEQDIIADDASLVGHIEGTDNVEENDAIVKDLVEWIKENGGGVDDRQVVVRGSVYASSFIPKDTVLLSVPDSLIWAPEDAKHYDPDADRKKDFCYLVQALQDGLNDYEKGESAFWPYMRYLTSLTKQVPSEWSDAGRNLLGDILTSDDRDGQKMINERLAWWKKTCGASLEDWTGRDAALLVRGYASVLIPSRGEEKAVKAMIPFHDFYAHKDGDVFDSQVSQDTDENGFVVTASRDIAAGEAIHTLGRGEPLDVVDHFLNIGVVQRFPQWHYFKFVDESADKLSKTLLVSFDLAEEGGLVTWVNDNPASSRAADFMRTELKRVKQLVSGTEFEALPVHEKQLISEFSSALMGGMNAAIDAKHDPWPVTPWTNLDYTVAGVNIGTYKLIGVDQDKASDTSAEPYELFEEFDIGDLLQGDENWKDLIELRRNLDRPNLRFYVDKVARKRWLPSKGISQAKQYVLKYASELSETADVQDEARTLYDLIPDEVNYAAKPSHNSEGKGVWLVQHDVKNNVTSYSHPGWDIQERGEEPFDKMLVAEGLAESLHKTARKGESLTLKNVKPGLTIEERYVDFDYFDASPVELNVFVIWGRVWLAFVMYVDGEGGRHVGCRVYRNGTLATASETGDDLNGRLNYIDWPRVVEIAETLGANKDMIRIDIFAGLPAGSPSLREGATREEKIEALEYIVSESEIYPTTPMKPIRHLANDGARLWVAGYKIGNYRTVPTRDIPEEFIETGALSEF